MEQFRVGDVVVCPRMRYYSWNPHKLTTIEEICGDKVKLRFQDAFISIGEIEPVLMDSDAAKAVYADMVVAAPTLRDGEPSPTINKDMSYFMESLKRSGTADGRMVADVLNEMNFQYVHEVQHFLSQNDDMTGITLRYL